MTRLENSATRDAGRGARIGRLLAAAICSVFVPAVVAAQSVSVDFAAASADHELLGNPLVGASVGLVYPHGKNGRVSPALSGEALRGESRRVGIPCSGLIPPNGCDPEPLRDESRLVGATGSVALRAFGGARGEVRLGADLALEDVRVSTRSTASGWTAADQSLMWGVSAHVEGVWHPVPHFPLGLEANVGYGFLTPMVEDQTVDGGSRLNGGFTLTPIRIGLVWQLPGA